MAYDPYVFSRGGYTFRVTFDDLFTSVERVCLSTGEVFDDGPACAPLPAAPWPIGIVEQAEDLADDIIRGMGVSEEQVAFAEHMVMLMARGASL